jgi:hypothetical protein
MENTSNPVKEQYYNLHRVQERKLEALVDQGVNVIPQFNKFPPPAAMRKFHLKKLTACA